MGHSPIVICLLSPNYHAVSGIWWFSFHFKLDVEFRESKGYRNRGSHCTPLGGPYTSVERRVIDYYSPTFFWNDPYFYIINITPIQAIILFRRILFRQCAVFRFLSSPSCTSESDPFLWHLEMSLLCSLTPVLMHNGRSKMNFCVRFHPPYFSCFPPSPYSPSLFKIFLLASFLALICFLFSTIIICPSTFEQDAMGMLPVAATWLDPGTFLGKWLCSGDVDVAQGIRL